jgi:hypothetical protein
LGTFAFGHFSPLAWPSPESGQQAKEDDGAASPSLGLLTLLGHIGPGPGCAAAGVSWQLVKCARLPTRTLPIACRWPASAAPIERQHYNS